MPATRLCPQPTTMLVAVAPLVALAIGCSGTSAPVANPFNAADRVPPPPSTIQTPAATATPYYQQGAPPAQPGIAQPGIAPSGYPTSPQSIAPTAPGSQPFAPTTVPGAAAPVYGTPPPAGGPYGATGGQGAPIAAGDRIATPTDAGPLRFASPDATAIARQATQPVDRSVSTVAGAAPPRRVATANGWIAGSAPVRSGAPGTTLASTPHVRLPSGGTVAPGGAPLEPAPFNPGAAGAGEPAPLRIASPEPTGWR